jgi:NAD(P)H-quinone oxidoreductase subunit 5
MAPGKGLKLRHAALGSIAALAIYIYLAQILTLQITAAQWLLLGLYSVGFGTLWRRRGWLMSLGMIAALVSVHLGLKALVETQIILSSSLAGGWALAWTAIVILALGAGGWLVMFGRNTALHQELYRTLYAGLYLDEWATRLTLALWPAQLPKSFPLIKPVLAQETRP